MKEEVRTGQRPEWHLRSSTPAAGPAFVRVVQPDDTRWPAHDEFYHTPLRFRLTDTLVYALNDIILPPMETWSERVVVAWAHEHAMHPVIVRFLQNERINGLALQLLTSADLEPEIPADLTDEFLSMRDIASFRSRVYVTEADDEDGLWGT